VQDEQPSCQANSTQGGVRAASVAFTSGHHATPRRRLQSIIDA
jgi:hypothetical protein